MAIPSGRKKVQWFWKSFSMRTPPLVHQRAVLRAQQHQLLNRRLATIGPVLDMVDVDKALVAAPREAAGVLVPATIDYSGLIIR
jgi:hypothetical protein